MHIHRTHYKSYTKIYYKALDIINQTGILKIFNPSTEKQKKKKTNKKGRANRS